MRNVEKQMQGLSVLATEVVPKREDILEKANEILNVLNAIQIPYIGRDIIFHRITKLKKDLMYLFQYILLEWEEKVSKVKIVQKIDWENREDLDVWAEEGYEEVSLTPDIAKRFLSELKNFLKKVRRKISAQGDFRSELKKYEKFIEALEEAEIEAEVEKAEIEKE